MIWRQTLVYQSCGQGEYSSIYPFVLHVSQMLAEILKHQCVSSLSNSPIYRFIIKHIILTLKPDGITDYRQFPNFPYVIY